MVKSRLLKLAARLRAEDGFTLVELLAAMAMSGIVLSTAGMVVVGAVKVTNTLGERTGSAQTGRVAVEQFDQRVRSMTCLFPGEYALNGSGTPAVTRAANILHASSNKLIYIGDVSNAGGTTGSTGSVGFTPQIRWLEMTGTIGPTGSATLVERWNNPTNSARPFNFTISPASSLEALATVSGAAGLTASVTRAMADNVQQIPGYAGHFTYYNDAGSVVAEVSGAVPLASLETITRIQFAFRVAGKRTSGVTDANTTPYVNDFYVRTITDRCEGA